MKYIIVEAAETGMPSAILFAENLTHRDVAGGQKVLSAGFCDALSGQCWGRSESLGVSSQAADRALIKMALNVALTPPPMPASRRVFGFGQRPSCQRDAGLK